MNTIGTVKFEFIMRNQVFARELYGRWNNFFAHTFEQVANSLLSKHDIESEIIQIDCLELDLGVLYESDFDNNFTLVLKEKMEEALLQCLFNTQVDNKINKTSEKTHVLEVLKYFLLNGTLKWTCTEYGNIDELFAKVINENSEQLKQFLQTYGHYTSLQQRLVYQLTNMQLESGVHLLEPGSAVFICSYVKFLHSKYNDINQPSINKTNYTDTVWLIIYAYMLNKQSSFSDKKTFVAQTILQLATKYNLSYSKLIELITLNIESYANKITIPIEFFTILKQLKYELDEQQFKQSYNNAAKFYHTISNLINKKLATNITRKSREALISILSKAESCRLFIQHLSDSEIANLVPIVAPNNSDFVLQTAHVLDVQKTQGALQAKAGSEYRLLKWQIIFPILLEKKSGLNRFYFVERVFKSVASHYNCTVSDLLAYILKDKKILESLDKELLSILNQLNIQYHVDRVENQSDLINDNILNIITVAIKGDIALSKLQIKQIVKHLANTVFCKKLISTINDTDKYSLIKLLYNTDSELIVAYARNLDLLHNKGTLEGKTGGEFKNIKWYFIFTVLSQMPQNLFNAKTFVRQVLQKLSAHYNVSYFDLLHYFQLSDISAHLPFNLHAIINQLYCDEQNHWINIVLQSTVAADKYKLVSVFTHTQVEFVKSYKKALERCYKHTKGLQSTSLSNFKNITWRFIFAVLFGMQNQVFNKKQFVLSTLNQLAAHYQISLITLLKYFNVDGLLPKTTHFTEISNIINELYSEHKKTEKESDIKQISESKQYKAAKINEQDEKKAVSIQNDTNAVTEALYINNAGMVLLAPFLPRLFSMLALIDANKFIDTNAQIKALYLTQYAVFGHADFPEHELVLNKLLTGFKTGKPIPRNIELTSNETDTANSMLLGVLQNWAKLKSTTVEGLRDGFLQRNGKLEDTGDIYTLTVEEKAYDMLLDSAPWNFRTIKYSWMDKPIQVKWR